MADEIILIRGTRYVVWECRTCGCVSTVPEIMNGQARAEGGYRHCPSGHAWGWSKETSEREQLRRERDRLKQDAARLEQERADAWATATALHARAAKAEADTKRLKKRASAGSCPCCRRTFSNMATHMKRQHPDFVKDGGTNVIKLKAHKSA